VVNDRFKSLANWKQLFTSQTQTFVTVKAAKYEIQKPSTCHTTMFHCKFWLMFPVFHLACQLVMQQKHLLRVEESCCKKWTAGLLWATNFGFEARFSSNSQLDAQQICSCSGKSTNQSTAFLRPATNVSVVDQVDHAKWKARNINQNLPQNNVAREVEGFCISYFATLT